LVGATGVVAVAVVAVVVVEDFEASGAVEEKA
jgi:hypothetical protein